MRILLLEDELILKESIEEFLLSKNYIVDSFETSDDAFNAIFTMDYDLLLLDVNVPGEWNGFSLQQELIKEGKNIATIFITSMTSADAMLQGYSNGCCDYIKKPFDLIELFLRVQHALKIYCFKTKESFIELCKNWQYNVTANELIYNSQPIALSKREGELLNVFIMNRNKVVTLDMLYDKVWGSDVDSANARVQINKLRRKLPQNIIKNIYGLGYRLDC